MMDVMAWPVFPAEAVSLASPEPEQQSMRDTLALSSEWGQSNSFCSIFSQAARVRMPVELWVPSLRRVINTAIMANMIVYQGGGGLEVAGALQTIADLMLQSVTVTTATPTSPTTAVVIDCFVRLCVCHHPRCQPNPTIRTF